MNRVANKNEGIAGRMPPVASLTQSRGMQRRTRRCFVATRWGRALRMVRGSVQGIVMHIVTQQHPLPQRRCRRDAGRVPGLPE